MTIYERADFMEKLECIQALNLDGGGSSNMVFENSIKNSPLGDEDEGDGEETTRQVSDALIIRPRI